MKAELKLAAVLGAAALAAGGAFALAGRRGDGGGAAGARAAALSAAARPEAAALAEEVAARKRAIARLEEALASVERSVAEAREENAALREMLNDLLLGAPPRRTNPAGSIRGDMAASPPQTNPAGSVAGGDGQPAAGGEAPARGAAAAPSAYGTPEAAFEADVKAVLARVRDEEAAHQREREQRARTAEARRTVGEIAGRLALRPEQTEGLVAAMVERGEKMREMWTRMREGGGVTRDEMRAARTAVRDEYEAKVQATLDAAQYQELLRIREEQEREGGGEQGFGPQRQGGRN